MPLRRRNPPRRRIQTHVAVATKARRGDLALIPHLSSIIRNSNREDGEVREERLSPPRHKGHKGEKMQATSAKDTEKRGLWFVDYPSLL
jgi:hypothetical protein